MRRETTQSTMEPAWLEYDNEARARTLFARERIALMEEALAVQGLSPGSLTYRVAVFLAKVARHWAPVQKSWAQLANDKAITPDSENLAHRKRSIRRVLEELQDAGLIEEYSTSETKRRSVVVKISLSKTRLENIARHRYGQVDETVDEHVGENMDVHVDTTMDEHADETMDPILPHNPQSSSHHSRRAVTEGEVVWEFKRLNVRTASKLVPAALERGCTLRNLLAIVRWYERSQRANPKHWNTPENVLFGRLKDAEPKIAAWKLWPDGLARPKPPKRPQAVTDYHAKRESARREYAGGPSVTELFRQLQNAEGGSCD